MHLAAATYVEEEKEQEEMEVTKAAVCDDASAISPYLVVVSGTRDRVNED